MVLANKRLKPVPLDPRRNQEEAWTGSVQTSYQTWGEKHTFNSGTAEKRITVCLCQYKKAFFEGHGGVITLATRSVRQRIGRALCDHADGAKP